MTNANQKISKADLDFIRSLDDFDLIMLISEVHDHGWPTAEKTLALICGAYKKLGKNTERKRPNAQP